MGRAAAATLPEAEAALLEQHIEAADGAMWAEYRQLYRNGLRQCAEQQFCTCFGEYMPAIHAVASPLFRSRNRAFAINCGIPAFRLQPGQLEHEIGPRIHALASSIRALVKDAEPATALREKTTKKITK